jgi:hypothetical protein
LNQDAHRLIEKSQVTRFGVSLDLRLRDSSLEISKEPVMEDRVLPSPDEQCGELLFCEDLGAEGKRLE